MSAQVTITQLPAAGALTGGEIVPIVQNGQTVRTTSAAIGAANGVTSVATGTGLTGGPITSTGTISIANTAVTAGSYTLANITVNSQGQITSASNGSVASGVTTLSGGTTGLTPATATAGAITLGGTLVVGNGGTGVSTLAAGSIPYGAGTSAFGAVALGTTNYVLTAGATAPQYVAQSTLAVGTSTNLAGGANGSVPYQTGSGVTTFLAAGTNGYVLTLASGVPTWANPASTGVSTFSGGTTGLTPNTATSGVVTLAGTLAVANGGTGVTASSGANSVTLRDANNNITANAYFNGFTTVAASGTLITLTVASTPVYLVSGSGGQIIKLPDATTLPLGTIFSFNNNQSSGAITVNNNSSTLVVSVPSGGYTTVVLIANGTAAGSWDRHDQTPSNTSWSTNTLDYPGSITSATWTGATVAPSRGGTGQSTYTDGQLLIGNSTGNTLAKSTLTAGASIGITNGSGTITIAYAQRVVVIADGTSITMNADTTDIATQANTQILGTLTVNAPTGTPVNGQKLMLRLTSTNVQTFSWNAIFAGSTDQALPTASSGASKTDYMGFIYNSTASKWQMLAKNLGF